MCRVTDIAALALNMTVDTYIIARQLWVTLGSTSAVACCSISLSRGGAAVRRLLGVVGKGGPGLTAFNFMAARFSPEDVACRVLHLEL